jgi:hypothetical protein
VDPRNTKRNIKKTTSGLKASQDKMRTSRMYLRGMTCCNMTKVTVCVFRVVPALSTKEAMAPVVQLQSENLLDGLVIVNLIVLI